MKNYHIMIFGENVSTPEVFISGENALDAFENAVAENGVYFNAKVDVLVRNESNGLIVKFKAEL